MRLIEELDPLEMGEPALQRCLRLRCDGLQQGHGDVLADHGGRLQEILLGWW
jgi:hypothetical protein